MNREGDDVSEEVLAEGCYHLSKLGMKTEKVAAHFELSPEEVERLVASYSSKLKSGELVQGDFDRTFWQDVMKEAEGDVKVTFVSEKGFHHAWKSELSRLSGNSLMAIYEASKDFINSDPNQKFLDVPPPKGYDPLMMDREIRKAVGVIEELLAEKWNAESGKSEPFKG